MDKPKSKNYTHLFVIFLVAFLVVFAWEKMSFVLSVFAPVLYGGAIAYILDGVVRFFTKNLRIKRIFSVLITVVLVLGLGTVAFYYGIPFLVKTVGDLIDSITNLLTEHNTGIYQIINNVAVFFNVDINAIYNFDITKIDDRILDIINKTVPSLSTFLLNRIKAIGSSVISIVFSIIIAVYMLIEKEDLLYRAKRLIRSLSSEKHEERVLNAFTMANTVFKKFIMGKFIDSAIIGFLIYILFVIFGVEYAAVFSLILAIGNMIPYVGSWFATVPIILVLLIINPWHAVVALAIVLIVQQVDSNVISPKVLSDNIGVSAFWIVFAVTVCGSAFGFVGMLLGVPIVVVLKNLIEDFVEARLSDREEIKTVDEVVVKNAQEQ